MSSYSLSTSECGLSPKQSEQLATLEALVLKLGIKLHLNEPLPENISEPVSIDIEHDEQGGFVGIGCYISSINAHYWFNRHVANYPDLSSVSITAHNGVSDLDILRYWGFQVNDAQLYHDTMLIGHILDSSLKAYGLKDMAHRELGVEYPSYDEIVGRRTAKQSKERLTLDKQPARLVQLYNALDCYVTAKIAERQRNGIAH